MIAILYVSILQRLEILQSDDKGDFESNNL